MIEFFEGSNILIIVLFIIQTFPLKDFEENFTIF